MNLLCSTNSLGRKIDLVVRSPMTYSDLQTKEGRSQRYREWVKKWFRKFFREMVVLIK